jgi:two-component system sensor histidine kinase UhpB
MRLIIRLIAQLIVIVAITLAVTTGYVMIDAHKSVEVETAATADRVAFELENLFWREILWRGSMRRDKVLHVLSALSHLCCSDRTESESIWR